jgi:hypothetical protein
MFELLCDTAEAELYKERKAKELKAMNKIMANRK